MAAASEALERNLRLYAWHQLTAGTLFWGPIFFFYFSERFPVEQVLQLASIYYLSVVLLEVPSGYFSDRISRVATLRISNAAMVGKNCYCSALKFELLNMVRQTRVVLRPDDTYQISILKIVRKYRDCGVLYSLLNL